MKKEKNNEKLHKRLLKSTDPNKALYFCIILKSVHNYCSKYTKVSVYYVHIIVACAQVFQYNICVHACDSRCTRLSLPISHSPDHTMTSTQKGSPGSNLTMRD